mmetsp:Transcript_35644/g.58451  ORF Transcript_35644/g.58451 Transcript_35644/m.58451 type:complete len:147 (+) Transcript_35644:105-545(+)|eukprot:CAMPEP_0202687468 /NCGR_PEP_ID=MMETSP1385-20130828/3150_1 /ASSEMBLY_ACC=CAM_ASM_000861 /TAXON_ID=933848 /ORGANISM="Elphidium margaritaceum" /LENGTH=146 /DNA_ID=CAMNT_0049342269 /DNA_START=99 /DNA_END=539 /DNA_ORIENTATION=-
MIAFGLYLIASFIAMKGVDAGCVVLGTAPWCKSQAKLSQQCLEWGLNYCGAKQDNCVVGRKVLCCQSSGECTAGWSGAIVGPEVQVPTSEVMAEGYAIGVLSTIAIMCVGMGAAYACQGLRNKNLSKFQVISMESDGDEERVHINH